ncbi:hypothetical protein F4779DRAFT_549192 [Xylariaceae sp. FL0662B]|nr:hypothetical protein F4779DRAFT_549192 [Xylariaceae sp. FL0662B]
MNGGYCNNLGERGSKLTCLSAENHDCDIKDHLMHYLGCIEIRDRDGFFEHTNPLWNREINHLIKLKKDPVKARRIVEGKRESWMSNCWSELRRIAFLRKTLANDSDDNHLVQQIEKSRRLWYDYCQNKNQNICEGRQDKHTRTPFLVEAAIEVGKRDEPYEPEKDVSVPIIQFKDGDGVDDMDERVWNSFPNQKTILNKLLQPQNRQSTEDNLLHKDRDREDNRIKYFHIPSNNMIWAERAIGLYFGEDRPDYHATHRQLMREEKTQTYMVLREPYWRSQLHGGQPGSPAHARHLRPLCSTISSKPYGIDDLPNNMVLFMPYLHWDTSRKREQFALEIDNIMAETKENAIKHEKSEKDKRKQDRGSISRQSSVRQEEKQTNRMTIASIKQKWVKWKENTQSSDKPESQSQAAGHDNPDTRCHQSYAKRVNSFGTLVERLGKIKNPLPTDENGRVQVVNLLGQYLLDAARLYEGITNYRDKKLLRKFLSEDPPLHPRRTLDQAYYWTLDSTRNRDRDQVVYRGTTAKPEDFHKYDYEAGVWTKHKAFGIEGECDECRLNIQKLSRVIMVDQLWMWILDAKTIITCFPKRYGANKQDPSGVHKSIRVRLQDNGPGQIRSVFDLALIIIDECSNTFFDRTRTVDPQPQVIDAFLTAIGNIMHKQTTAFERLWRWTDQASKIYRSNGHGDTSELHVPLLDINPEGKLEREIKDIIEELDIMIHITKTHKEILAKFVANAESILDPYGTFGDNDKRAMNGRRLWNKSFVDANNNSSSSQRHPGEEATDDKRNAYIWFKLNADERIANVVERIEELEELRSSAVSTAISVKDLLELKQQQASVVQAWQAIKQSEETIKQGRSIMMFTLVTIVFLPLSFMSSVFGMNNVQFSGDSWQIKDEFLFMFPISAAVIFISLLLAFSTWIRAAIWYLYKWLTTTFLVGSGLYGLWLDLDRPSKSLHRRGTELADQLMNNAKEARFARRLAERTERDKKVENERRCGGGGVGGGAPSGVSSTTPRMSPHHNGNGNSAGMQNGGGSRYHFPFVHLSRYRTRDVERNDIAAR